MMLRTTGRIWVALCALAIACSQGDPSPRADAAVDSDRLLHIEVVNYPLAYFAERIGGAEVDVHLGAPPDVDPADWSPDTEEIGAFQRADLVLRNGAGYARWTALASLRRANQVDTSAAFRDRLIPRSGATSHKHGPEGAHSHSDWAFTTWLDPTLAAEQARAIERAVAKAHPAGAAEFAAALAEVEGDLESLDAKLRTAADALAGRPILFSHPVYAYLERRYALDSRSLHWEPDEAPGDADWHDLDLLRREHPAQIMVWEAEPLDATRARLRQAGIASVVLSPCGNRPVEGDWLETVSAGADALADAARRLVERGSISHAGARE